MAPRLDKLSPPPAGPTFPGCDPNVLREATARMNMLGIEGEVVHSTSDPEEMRAYLESLWGVRSYELSKAAGAALRSLGPALGRAAAAVIAELMDEHVPLVGPADFSVARGPQIMGRPVPGTDLAVYYVPAGVHVFVVDVVRHP